MSNIILAYKNVADNVLLALPNPSHWAIADGVSSLNRVKNGLVTNQALTTDAAIDFTWFGFKLTANGTSPATVEMAQVLAIVGHNFSQDAIVRMRAGLAVADVDFVSRQERDTRFGANYSGGVNGTYHADTGLITTGAAPRVDHDPAYYKNGFLQSSAQNTSWLQTNGLALSDGRTVLLGSAGAYHYQAGLTLYADNFTVSGKVRLMSGSGDFCFFTNDGTEHAGATIAATADWQDFTQTLAGNAYSSGGTAGVKKLTDQGVLQFREMQIERGATKTEHRKTSTTRRFKCRGLLREPARTNLCLQSQAFGTTWTTNLLTVTSDTTVSPAGAVAADTLTNSATAGDCYVSQTMTNAGVTCHSAFVKKGTAARAKLRVLTAATAPTDDSVFFDFTTLTFSGATGAFSKVGYVPENDGYFRLYAVKAAQAGQTASTMRLMPASTGNASVNGETLIVWGGQTEAAESPSSYIPTTTATVTRTVDGAFANNTDLNAAEGTLYVESEIATSALIQSVATTALATVRDAGATNKVDIRFLTDPASPTTDATSSTGLDTANAAVLGDTVIREAVRYRASDWALYKDGSSVGTSASFAVPAGMDRIGLDAPTVPVWTRRVSLWRQGLTNAQLALLTASGPGAIDYDSGWVPAVRLALDQGAGGDRYWGTKHDIQFILPAAVPVQFGVFQVHDPLNVDSLVAIGRLFVGGGSIQPTVNMSYGMSDSLDELSQQTIAPDGTLWTQGRPRKKRVAFSLDYLSPAEGDRINEMQGFAGIAEEVYYVPDPADLAYSQRFGFLGQMSKINPLQYPRLVLKANAVEIRQK